MVLYPLEHVVMLIARVQEMAAGCDAIHVSDLVELPKEATTAENPLASSITEAAPYKLSLHPIYQSSHFFLVAKVQGARIDLDRFRGDKPLLILFESLSSNQHTTYADMKTFCSSVDTGLWINSPVKRSNAQAPNDCSVHMIFKMVLLLQLFRSGKLFVESGQDYIQAEFETSLMMRKEQWGFLARFFLQGWLSEADMDFDNPIGKFLLEQLSATITFPTTDGRERQVKMRAEKVKKWRAQSKAIKTKLGQGAGRK